MPHDSFLKALICFSLLRLNSDAQRVSSLFPILKPMGQQTKAKLGLWPVCVNKALLEDSHTHWLTYYLRLLLATMARVKSYHMDNGPQSEKYLLSDPLEEPVCRPCSDLRPHLVSLLLLHWVFLSKATLMGSDHRGTGGRTLGKNGSVSAFCTAKDGWVRILLLEEPR